jgi:RNA polymerase sigma-B factor
MTDPVVVPEQQAVADHVPEPRSTSRWGDTERAREKALIALMTATDPDDPAHRRARDELVTLHLPLVQFLARRFRDRGEPLDDLVQVGTIGLIKAVDRFDPERGVEFSTYATPTIVGEIKRHFRDKGWAIRVPRRLQELRISLGQATAELSQKSGRAPTVHELAEHLGISEDDVIEGLEGAQAYSTTSLDAHGGSDDGDESPSLADRLGGDDLDLEAVEYRESLKPLLAALPSRERRILALRFFHGMTQSEIAAEVGISQMHVSRLLAKSLATLREGMSDET